MGNYSKQREKIIKIIAQMSNIPNAEEIYCKVKEEDSAISRSTVYRNLIYFVKSGLLIQIPISSGTDRYFYKLDDNNYGFVVCKECGKIQEFICDFDISDFQKNILKQTSTSVFKNEMLLKGVCKDCKLKKERNDK